MWMLILLVLCIAAVLGQAVFCFKLYRLAKPYLRQQQKQRPGGPIFRMDKGEPVDDAEIEKLNMLLHNIDNYDGTAKGQVIIDG